MTKPDLEELKRLLERGTPGPWCVYSEPDVGLSPSIFAGSPMVWGFTPIEPMSYIDMDLIVTLRNAAPSLLAENERLKDERDAAHHDIDRLRATGNELVEENERLKAESVALKATLERSEQVLWQLLDDMGDDGLSVCEQAKTEAVEALAVVRIALGGSND